MDLPSDRQIATLDKNDTWTLLHATRLFHIGRMIHGFNTSGAYDREYSTATHEGLFVTHLPSVAQLFGSEMLAFRVRVRDLYPVDYNGNTGPEVIQRHTKEDPAELYPESDRPFLSYRLLDMVEPQALFVGSVGSGDIEGVYWKRWYSRDKFLDEFEGRTFQGPGTEDSVTIGEPQMDRSKADPSVSDLIDHMTEVGNLSRDRAERYLETLVKGANRNEDPESWLASRLETKANLDPAPARNLARKLLN